MKLLVCGLKTHGVEAVQLEGLSMYRGAVRQSLGLDHRVVLCPDAAAVEQAVLASLPDFALVMFNWSESVERIAPVLERLRERTAGKTRLILLDHYAQTSTPLFSLLPYVDRYAKRQVLKDASLYRQSFRGGYIFTDYFSQRFEFDLDGWHFGSVLPSGEEDKLVHAWNLGVRASYRRRLWLNRLLPRPWHKRRYDINGRLGLADPNRKREWYQAYRLLAIQQVERLAGRRRVTGAERVSPRAYLRELRDSRIVFSPFGWGELCYRDFEAVCSGALLLKPSMTHVRTSPDIFIEHQTYVPLKWDFSDFDEQVEHYLTHPEEAQSIARRAQEVLTNYFKQGGFVADLKRSLGL